MTQLSPKPSNQPNSSDSSLDNLTNKENSLNQTNDRQDETTVGAQGLRPDPKPIVITTQTKPLPPPSPQNVKKTLPKVVIPQTSTTSSQGGLSQWWQKLSLQGKAAVAATTLGVLPALLVGSIALGVAGTSLNNQVTNNLKTETKDQVESLRSFLRDRYSNLLVLSQQEIWTHPNLRNSVSLAEKNQALANILQEYPAFSQLAVLNNQGNVIAQAGKESLKNQSNTAYFKEILQGRSYVSLIPGQTHLDMAVPVKDAKSGAILGAVYGKIAIAQITNTLGYQATQEGEETAKSEGNFYYLVNPEKNIIASNHTDDLGLSLAEEFPKLVAQLKQQPTSDFLVSQEDHDKIPSVVSYRAAKLLEDSVNLDWDLVLVKENAQVYQPLTNLKIGLALGTFLTLALAALSAALVAQPLTRPVRRMAQAADKIGQGDLDIELPTGEDELGLLGKNINLMSQKLKNLLKEQSLSVEQSRLLAEIANRLILETETIDSLLGESLRRIRTVLKADRVVVYRFRADKSGYVASEALGDKVSSALSEKFSDPCIPSDILDAYQQGKVGAVEDVLKTSLNPEHLNLMERLQVRGRLIAPLLNEGQLFGLMIVHHCHQPYQWPETEVNLVKQVAEQLSLTLDRLSFQEKRKEDTQRASLLKDITLSIAAALSSSDVFDVAVTNVRRALNSDRVIVYQFNPDWSGIIIAESVSPQFPKALGVNINDPCFADKYVEKYRQGRVQATSDIHEANLTPCHLNQLAPLGVRANLVTPIVEEGELLGLLIAHQCSGPRNWTQGEIDFMAQVATQVGLALERTDLIAKQKKAEEEQRKAREQLQKRALELLMQVDPVSQGDLTIRAQVTEDEIGTIADSYNATIESLRKIVTQVQLVAGQLADTASSNEMAVSSLSEEAVQQASDIAAALDRLEMMTNAIREVALNAEQAESAVQMATATVETGEEAMNRTVDGIMAIRETVAETAKKVKRLGESSQKISKVVNLISSFADQTNLLALNASIEAAHAGEEGRGFAVVADEVRSLARQSAAATAEIEALVANIQAETNEVVAAMEAGTEQVVMGTKLVDETRKSLNQITVASIQISELVEAIAQTAVQQADTSQSVTQTMAQVAAISDRTSAEASQVSESFRQLLQVSQALTESVRQFKVK
jgi:methyl-accepting chemotaxis protein PixJ